MQIERFLEISQTVEIDITAEQITVILEEPWNNEEETKQMIMCNLNSCFTYMRGLPVSAIRKLTPEVRKILADQVELLSVKWKDLL